MTIDEMKNAIDNAMSTIEEDDREELYASLLELEIAENIILYLEEGGEWPDDATDEDIETVYSVILD